MVGLWNTQMEVPNACSPRKIPESRKFQGYFKKYFTERTGPLFAHAGIVVENAPNVYFQLVVGNNLDKIIQKYEESGYSSLQFYQHLRETKRLEIVDGSKVLELLRTAYRKANILPSDFQLTFETDCVQKENVYIINFPTKRHWRDKSRMQDIEAGLDALAQEIRQRGICSVAIPPLGSGLGGLDWSEVRPRIEAALASLADVDVLIFEPLDAATEAPAFRAKEAPKMTPGRASLVGLMDRYLAALLDPFITLLEVHKLMYFLQEAGEPLRLRFVKGPYGPYAENLRHVLAAIEGHLIAGYSDGGDTPYKQLVLVPGAVAEATTFLRSHADTHGRFDRVTRLVDGFETPFGLELLSTVHWVMAHDGVEPLPAVAQAVHDWTPGKWQFTAAQIELASERLQAEGWLRIVTPAPIP